MNVLQDNGFHNTVREICPSDEPHSGRPHALSDEALPVPIEEGRSLTCDELANQFIVFDKTVRLQQHLLGKAVGSSQATTSDNLYVVAFSPQYSIHIQSSAY
ncbi:hypothetical protein NPIL_157031 [Nephila pilipes]|uniref:Uncharacterized protein n=1 Tax=Nephila pilipes TaxID=299642 RepID=A0A8X6NQ07_NEPPI|nr:hypothetical protein NPIL_157031 [Nephila pilipes]